MANDANLSEVSDIIQLMRLSGTDKVREFLTYKSRQAENGDRDAGLFLEQVHGMFLSCKRDSIFDNTWGPVT